MTAQESRKIANIQNISVLKERAWRVLLTAIYVASYNGKYELTPTTIDSSPYSNTFKDCFKDCKEEIINRLTELGYSAVFTDEEFKITW